MTSQTVFLEYVTRIYYAALQDGMVENHTTINLNTTTTQFQQIAFAPKEGQSLSNFIDASKLPKGFLVFDSGDLSILTLRCSNIHRTIIKRRVYSVILLKHPRELVTNILLRL